jgi:hypothetical protein
MRMDQIDHDEATSAVSGLGNLARSGAMSRISVWYLLIFSVALFIAYNPKNLPGMWHVSISSPMFETDPDKFR